MGNGDTVMKEESGILGIKRAIEREGEIRTPSE